MGRNTEKEAVEMAAKKQRILEAGFRVFSEQTIEKVTMSDVAQAAGVSVATLYRYYSTKPQLVMGINEWAWERYVRAQQSQSPRAGTAAQRFEFYLDAFIDLYRNHRDLLRFNQYFNVFVQNEAIPSEDTRRYTDMIGVLRERFLGLYRDGKEDGTLRTDLPPGEMFTATIHLMLAVTTRYAVGLLYARGTDPEEELRLLKRMILERFTA